MTKRSGVKGKTVLALARANHAEGRKAVHDTRTPEKQLAELDTRPGEARRERARLALVVPPVTVTKVAEDATEGPKRPRRRARREGTAK